MKNLFKAVFLTTVLFTGTVNADQGVTDTQVLIGSNQDMSGPFAALALQRRRLHKCILMK